MAITPEELDLFFKQRNNRYTSKYGLKVIRMEDGDYNTMTLFPDINPDTVIDEDSAGMTIHTFWDSASNFIDLFKIKTLDDLAELSYQSSWTRYLNSGAEMIISILEPEADVHFRLLGPKTIIFSPELHFYDEVFVHLTLREDFERYLKDNSGLLKEVGGWRQDFKDKQDNF